MAPLAAVAALVRGQLRVAVRADGPEILPPVVRRASVDVVEDEGERQVEPDAGSAADRAASRLFGGEVVPNVVPLVTIDPGTA